MGLYGDKLTAGTTTAADLLTREQLLSPKKMDIDLLPSTDNITKGLVAAVDVINKSVIPIPDKLSRELYSIITAPGELKETLPETITVESTDRLPSSGSGVLQTAAGELIDFDYTGKTSTTLTGCYINEGTFAFAAGDKIFVLTEVE